MDAPDNTDAEQLAHDVEIYAAGRADVQCGRYVASTPALAARLELIHATWMEQLCRTSAGLLPFDDTAERALASSGWLRRLQERA